MNELVNFKFIFFLNMVNNFINCLDHSKSSFKLMLLHIFAFDFISLSFFLFLRCNKLIILLLFLILAQQLQLIQIAIPIITLTTIDIISTKNLSKSKWILYYFNEKFRF